MKTQWISGLEGEGKENFKVQVLQAKNVLDKLSEILYNRVREKQSVKSPDYDSPSWSHKQAHTNGMLEAFEEVLTLIKV